MNFANVLTFFADWRNPSEDLLCDVPSDFLPYFLLRDEFNFYASLQFAEEWTRKVSIKQVARALDIIWEKKCPAIFKWYCRLEFEKLPIRSNLSITIMLSIYRVVFLLWKFTFNSTKHINFWPNLSLQSALDHYGEIIFALLKQLTMRFFLILIYLI